MKTKAATEYGGPTSKVARNHQAERSCAQLLGLISGITADGHLHDLEIRAKIDAAMKLREGGYPIFILDEDAWRAGLGSQ
ncbi:hypothetical protein AB4Z46_28115 [Variovorax sp. M-6]|uniref:hypothetical protein n=1 Tax=Variovorax sp. M-6 TaxID=3233041 RepID=UPI003F99AB12